MREITSHVVNPANDKIKIQVVDEPGPGGANHEYDILIGSSGFTMRFQKGGINEHGVNGVTQEALLAIVADRLCREKKKLTMDHIMPLALGGNGHRHNFQGLCRPCNSRKHAQHPVDFNRSRGLLL